MAPDRVGLLSRDRSTLMSPDSRGLLTRDRFGLMSPDRAGLTSAGEMPPWSPSTLTRCHSASGLIPLNPGLIETSIDPFEQLNEDIKEIREKIFLVRAEANSILHVLDREKHVAH